MKITRPKWFYKFEASSGGGVAVGLSDSTFMFVESEAELVVAVQGAFSESRLVVERKR